jgi:predicted transcriptional regulator
MVLTLFSQQLHPMVVAQAAHLTRLDLLEHLAAAVVVVQTVVPVEQEQTELLIKVLQAALTHPIAAILIHQAVVVVRVLLEQQVQEQL